MFCCCRPPATQDASTPAAAGTLQQQQQQQQAKADSVAQPAGAVHRRRSGSSESARSAQQLSQQQHHLGQVPVEPLARLGEGAAHQAPGLQPATSPHHEQAAHHSSQQHHTQAAQQQQQPRSSEDAGQSPQNDVLQLVALLQELLGLSTATPKQPLSRAMGLLVVRLPVDWACLHVFSTTGRVVMQVGAALSPEAQRQRGASGSAACATPVGSTPVRQRLSYNALLTSTSSTGSASGGPGSGIAGSAAGVQEVGAGHLAALSGSGSSLELVCGSRQALALYAGDDGEAAALPPDWQRLYADRDMRSFLAVPIIASGSAGSIIGALSFGLTSITDWGLAWWMSSIQLLCGWAAGALPQNRATARVAFFDALWSATDLQDLGRVFVQQLPSAMADQAQHKLEARLALVSSRVASCMMFARAPDNRPSAERQQPSQQQPQQPQQQPQQQQQCQQAQGALSEEQQRQQQQQQQQQDPKLPQQAGQEGGAPTNHQAAGGHAPSPGGGGQVPEGMILSAADDTGVWAGAPEQGAQHDSSSSGNSKAKQPDNSLQEQQQGHEQEQPANGAVLHEPVSCFTLPTSNSVLASALEWGEVMVVKDTVTYFGRNAAGGSSAVRDLFLPDRPMVRGTLVLLPLVYRCRAVGCVYLLAPWDIHAELGKAALQETAALLAPGTFKALLRGGRVQQDWYRQVLSEGPMPSVPETDSTSSNTAAAAALDAATQAAPAAAEGAGGAVTAPLAQAAQAIPASASLSALPLSGGGGAEGRSKSSGGDGWGSGEGTGMLGAAGSCDSMERSAVSATGAVGTGGTASNSCNIVNSAPLPLSTPEAVMAAAAAASSAAAAAAAIAPVGLPVSGHAASGFQDLVLWPELLDIKSDLARSRHTAVYTAEYGGHLLALKLFRYSTAMDYSSSSQLHGGGGGPGAGGAGGPAAAAGIGSLLGHHGASGSSGGNVASEAELEAVLSLQYRLCNLSHTHLLQHVAVYPRVYEVAQRRSSREPPDVYLAAMAPRKERHHRCAALISEHAAGGCLRDAVNRGQVHVPTAATLQAAAAALGWNVPVDVACLSAGQVQEVLGQVSQQLPLLKQPSGIRPSGEISLAAAQPAGASAPLLHLQQPVVAASPSSQPSSARTSHELQRLWEPYMPLLRQLLLHIALGMQHLHAHGIIHGELRLDNVMISGALPPPLAMLQQQAARAAAAAQALAAAGADAAAAGPAVGAEPEPSSGVRRDSSMGSSHNGMVSEGQVGSSSSSQVHGGSSRLTSSAAAAPPAAGMEGSSGSSSEGYSSFVLKLKDIGLCTLGFTNRQCVLRKLAGRPRLQAVSWLAPECFRGEGLSKYSDIYAFGILMWELYTGEVAFNDLVTSNTKVLQTIIGDGVRPQFPDSTQAWYVNLASRCWAGAPKSRPSFRRIVQALQTMEDAPAPARS